MRVKRAGKSATLFVPAREQLPHGASSQRLEQPAGASSSHMLGLASSQPVPIPGC